MLLSFFRQAQIGGHSIYKIEDTKLIPIANELVRQRFQRPDEAKLVMLNPFLNNNEIHVHCFSFESIGEFTRFKCGACLIVEPKETFISDQQSISEQ